MQTDVVGKVRNTRLGASKVLLALFEAIVNSIQAIEERSSPAGARIIVRILRSDNGDLLLLRDGAEKPITGFAVEDNGIGFTKENFDSFNTSETTHKSNRGGRGVGRFSWLKSFNQVQIESNYQDSDGWRRRSFAFRLTPEGVEELTDDSSKLHELRTVVTLCDMKSEYVKYCPKRAITIAHRIVEHCLSYFLHEDCMEISVRDDDGDNDIELRTLYKDSQRLMSDSTITVKDCEFRVVVLRTKVSDEQSHRLHFCADKREVTTESLSAHMPELPSRLIDREGVPYVCSVYVYGKYLDENVGPERQDFALSRGPEEQMEMYQLSMYDIRDGVLKNVEKVLDPVLAPMKEEKEERVRAYVERQAPQYRPVLKHRIQAIEKLPHDASDDKIDDELYKAKRDMEREVREYSLRANGGHFDNGKYREYLGKITDLTQADLAKYVLHRRYIIEELERTLSLADDKYGPESAVHGLIYPMKATSDSDVEDEQRNLWIIDERLMYHRFLASDVEFYKILRDSTSGRRPDIVIFNRPIAVVEDSSSVSSVVILEFKQPMRNSYPDDEKDNPIFQVLDYAAEIRRNGKVKNVHGRPITVPESAPFYAYIMCDITPKVDRFCSHMSYRKTPDGRGYYGYNDHLSLYVEVISYEKIVDDAKRRNRVFFEKLGVPIR